VSDPRKRRMTSEGRGRTDAGGSSGTPEGRARRRVALALAGLLLALPGCGDGDPSGPGEVPRDEEVPGSELTFLRTSADAPPLLTTDTTFVATKGQSLVVEVFYESESEPGERGDRFLSFELEEESLLRYPEDHPRAGDAFQTGDTVTITLRVDADTILAEFEPTGLQFDPDEPAELEINYVEADDDFDDDGESDPELEEEIDLWRQERPGEPWTRIGTVQDFELDEIEAELTSFTIYAVAI